MNNLIIDRFGNDVKIDVEIIGTGPPGTTDYLELVNTPQINSVDLIGNKTFIDLGIIGISNSEIEDLFL